MLTPLLLLLALAPGPQSSEPARRPNILFVFSDDHAPNAIGAYGGWLAGVNPTPSIDALARQGMLFEGSYCTNSICGPSRAVILTGKFSHRNGFRQNGDRFDGDQQTFPKLLQGAGYRTAMIGKWHLNSDPQGFDYWEVLPGQGSYYNPELISAQGRRQVEGHCTDIVTDLAIDWLEENGRGEKPWMLMCQQKAPHRTWMPAPRHLSLYADAEIPEPATLFDRWEDNASPARHQEMEIERDLEQVYDLFLDPTDRWDPSVGRANDASGFRNLERMTPEQRATWDAAFGPENAAFREAHLTGPDLVRWKYQRYIKNYLRCVRGVDECVGRLTAWLEENGLAENTVVVYSSDQGFFLGEHGWFDKRWMYEESLAMPLIVRWPGVTAPGSRNRDLVQNLDYAETFLEIAGVPVPDDMQGRSLVPLLRGQTPKDWRDAIYYHYYEFPGVHAVARHRGVRTRTHKLIQFYQLDEWELYDLEQDPDELLNVYGDPRFAEVTAVLRGRLDELGRSYGDDTDLSPLPEDERARLRGDR
jgi:arylsulfatase A-like enzyme